LSEGCWPPLLRDVLEFGTGVDLRARPPLALAFVGEDDLLHVAASRQSDYLSF